MPTGSDSHHEEELGEVQQVLKDYLRGRGMRLTPERSAIVDAVYNTEGHFSIEEIHHELQQRRFPVSLATLYNNVEMLIDANLLARHYFGADAMYERVYGMEPHYHRVCKQCGQVQDVRFDALTQFITSKKVRGFFVEPSSLYVYGLCSKCHAALRRKKRNSQKKNESRS